MKIYLDDCSIVVNTVNGKPDSITMGGVTFNNVTSIEYHGNDELNVTLVGNPMFKEVKPDAERR